MATTNSNVDVEDIVQVKNIGSQTWRVSWDSKQYKVEPGKTGFIPMHLIIAELGDPRSSEGAGVVTNASGRMSTIPNRSSEVARLCQLYGAYDDIPRLQRNAPKLELYDQEGERFFSVIEDTEGNSIMSAAPVEQDERSALYTHIAKLTARLDALENAGPGKLIPSDEETDETDTDSESLIGTKPDNPGDEYSTAFAGGVPPMPEGNE
jgi:hypothetical protein